MRTAIAEAGASTSAATQQLKPPRVSRDCNGEADRGCDPGSPAEREVDGREEQGQRRPRERPHDEAPPTSRETERQQRAHPGEHAQGVPVGEWLLEPVGGDCVVDAEPLREEPREEAVAGCEEDRDERRPQDDRHGRAAQQQDEGGENGHVQEHALALEHRRGLAVAPEQREPCPGGKASEPSERGERQSRGAHGVAEHERRRGHRQRDKRSPAPGGREIAPVVEGESGEAQPDCDPEGNASEIETRRPSCRCGRGYHSSEGSRVSGR